MPNQNLTAESAPFAVVNAVRRLGHNITTARTRRRLRQEDLARKAGISRPTLSRIEAGELGTQVSAYVAVLWALGLHEGVAALAAPEEDIEGQTLEAARKGERVRPRGELNDDF